MSHVDPRMSWGDLVARLVREGVARHDPRGGGSGQRRRRSAGSADASPRRAPNKTCAAGAAAGPAQRVHESSGRAPNRTRATGAPAAPARRGGGATPAPPGDTAATERQNPVAMLASAAPPSQSGPAALLDGARVGGAPSRTPLQRTLLRRRSSRPAPWRMAAMPAAPCRARRSPLRRRSRHSACPLTADRAARQPEQRRTQPAILSAAATSIGGPPPPAAAPHSRGCPAPHLATRRRTLLLSRSAHRAPLHLVPSAADRPPAASCRGGWPGAVQLGSPLLCSSPHAPRLRTGGSAGAPDVAPPPRCCRAARLSWPTARRWPAGTHFAAPRAERASSLPPLAVPVPTAAGAVPGHPA